MNYCRNFSVLLDFHRQLLIPIASFFAHTSPASVLVASECTVGPWPVSGFTDRPNTALSCWSRTCVQASSELSILHTKSLACFETCYRISQVFFCANIWHHWIIQHYISNSASDRTSMLFFVQNPPTPHTRWGWGYAYAEKYIYTRKHKSSVISCISFNSEIYSWVQAIFSQVNPLNTELNPICQ